MGLESVKYYHMDEKIIKITKEALGYKFPTKTALKFSSPESAQPPQEHLLHVNMGNAKLLLPGTPEYKQYDGLETGALASCTGIALYIPQGSDVVLGIGHLAPSENPSSLIEKFREQLRGAGIDFDHFRQQQGFIELIPGQTTYYREKSHLRDKIARVGEYLREQFPKLKGFPHNQVSYSVLSGHLSSRVKLLKNGRLIISGEGKAY